MNFRIYVLLVHISIQLLSIQLEVLRLNLNFMKFIVGENSHTKVVPYIFFSQ